MSSSRRHVQHEPLHRTKSRRELLQEAALSGDWPKVLDFLRHKPDNQLGRQGELLLQEAVKQSQLFYIDLLISKGVDPQATDSEGRSLLHLAVLNNRESVTSHLLKKVPQIKQCIDQKCVYDGVQVTAYQIADMNTNSQITSLLETNGAEPIRSPFTILLDETAEPPQVASAVHTSAEEQYHDWPKTMLNVQEQLEDSCARLQQQVVDINTAMSSAFERMQHMMSQLLQQQRRHSENTDNNISELRKQLTHVQSDVNTKTSRLNAGVTTILKTTDELRTSFKQAGEFNDYVYFRIFKRISQKVGLEKDRWKQLCRALLRDYPENFIAEIEGEIYSHHTKEEDMAYECLTKWHVYNSQQPNKIEALKKALTSNGIQPLQSDIDEILKDYKDDIPAIPKRVVSDQLLMRIADCIHKEYLSIGVYLGLSKDRLAGIDEDHRGNSLNRNFAMLSRWRDSQQVMGHTIQAKLIEAFKMVERRDLIALLMNTHMNGH